MTVSYKKSDSLPLPETELNGMMHQHFINSVTPEAKEEASKTDQGIVNGHVDEPPSLQRTFSIEDDLPPGRVMLSHLYISMNYVDTLA